jgi:hypothetical protein
MDDACVHVTVCAARKCRRHRLEWAIVISVNLACLVELVDEGRKLAIDEFSLYFLL